MRLPRIPPKLMASILVVVGLLNAYFVVVYFFEGRVLLTIWHALVMIIVGGSAYLEYDLTRR